MHRLIGLQFFPHQLLLIMAFFSFTGISAQTDMKKVIYTDKAPAPIGPYSQAIEAGGLVFISGQIAIDPSTGNYTGGQTVSEETRQVMQNLKAIVEAAGCTMSHVVKCTIFLDDMQKFAEVNAVYGTYFPENPPARETVAVVGLPKGAQVEISAVVVK